MQRSAARLLQGPTRGVNRIQRRQGGPGKSVEDGQQHRWQQHLEQLQAHQQQEQYLDQLQLYEDGELHWQRVTRALPQKPSAPAAHS
mmetsp:Transcript_10897/g.28398  ORF Transcript_10897/g.28398 Transcript_10897/m.28398 type:complete len:87 (-) Transcript_10897:2-262(-)